MLKFKKIISSAPLMVIYGQAGVGKTLFSCKTGLPTVFFPIEDGTATLDCAFRDGSVKDDLVQVAEISPVYGEFINTVRWLARNPGDFKIAVFDTIDALENMMAGAALDQAGMVCNENSSPRAMLEAMPYGRGIALLKGVFAAFLEAVKSLKQAGITVILLGHTQISDKDTAVGQSVRMQDLKLNKHNTSLLHESAELIANMRFDISVNKDKVGTIKQGEESKERRILQTGASMLYGSKKRYPIPDIIEANSKAWPAIFSCIPFFTGAAPTEKSPLYQDVIALGKALKDCGDLSGFNAMLADNTDKLTAFQAENADVYNAIWKRIEAMQSELAAKEPVSTADALEDAMPGVSEPADDDRFPGDIYIEEQKAKGIPL